MSEISHYETWMGTILHSIVNHMSPLFRVFLIFAKESIGQK